ncbi:histidine phosphatase family protein [Bifidobacterium sp. ESL0763]|uniref:histidine phosphatase family protein n=1 Tax=Bifidobacterium sp. ESL0763 TaxID=2983227 RepID=UPI0023F6E87E|nr:histidine phosphatase family protein [Bifidobacterium sp. ESL0763]MDF7663756.1 histidine phosphatase family protein [Bifidobacterium sp. ESL0763]
MIDEVILLRHGRTSYNVVHRLQGQVDVPLDIVGQWQVDRSGMELAKRYYWAKVGNIARHPDLLDQPGAQAAKRSDISEYQRAAAGKRAMKVVSSDLCRASRTAHAVADILGLPVTLDASLRERSFGGWEGLTRDEIRDKDPEAYRSWRAHRGGEAKYGVESRTEVGRRGADAITRLLDGNADDPTPTTLLVASHGSLIAATIETLLGMDAEVDALGNIPNAFWSTLQPVARPEGGYKWRLARFNEGPAIATQADWMNGPEGLRNPDMPTMMALRPSQSI